MATQDPEEVIVRVARFPSTLRPLDILAGNPPKPIPCDWLAIARVTSSGPDSQPSLLLYFIDEHGMSRECLQYETLRIAVDQAHAICAFPKTAWVGCSVPCRPGGAYDPLQLAQAAGA